MPAPPLQPPGSRSKGVNKAKQKETKKFTHDHHMCVPMTDLSMQLMNNYYSHEFIEFMRIHCAEARECSNRDLIRVVSVVIRATMNKGTCCCLS